MTVPSDDNTDIVAAIMDEIANDKFGRVYAIVEDTRVWLEGWVMTEGRVMWNLQKHMANTDTPLSAFDFVKRDSNTHYLYWGNHSIGRVHRPYKITFREVRKV